MTISYKIQSPDGKFSAGGSLPKFTKNGKTWNSKAALFSHLTYVLRSRYSRSPEHIRKYTNCDVISYGIMDDGSTTFGECISLKVYLAEAFKKIIKNDIDFSKGNSWMFDILNIESPEYKDVESQEAMQLAVSAVEDVKMAKGFVTSAIKKLRERKQLTGNEDWDRFTKTLESAYRELNAINIRDA